MGIMIEENSVYCPCCGKALFKKLMGAVEHDCPRCRITITCIVNGHGYTVMASKPEITNK